MIVVDANVVAYLLLEGPQTARAEALLSEQEVPVNSAEVVRLVEASDCSAYDCEFVAAALALQTSPLDQALS